MASLCNNVQLTEHYYGESIENFKCDLVLLDAKSILAGEREEIFAGF
jgi:hypothetical protein